MYKMEMNDNALLNKAKKRSDWPFSGQLSTG